MKSKFPYLAFAYSPDHNEYVLVINHTFEYVNPLAVTFSLSTGKFEFYYLNSIIKINKI